MKFDSIVSELLVDEIVDDRVNRIQKLKGLQTQAIIESNKRYGRLPACDYKERKGISHEFLLARELPDGLEFIREKYNKHFGDDPEYSQLYVELQWEPDVEDFKWWIIDNVNALIIDDIWTSENVRVHEKINQFLVDLIVKYNESSDGERALNRYFNS
jgi:hypothetical protein